MYKNVQIIAEVKTQSPFGFRTQKSWDELFKIADSVGDVLSIHTDPRWGGSFDLIRRAKSLTRKPVMAKGIHATDDLVQQAIEAGADFVLVVGRIPNLPKEHTEKCIIEPNTIAELKALPNGTRAVWNARNLADGSPKKETFADARTAFSGWLCQASFIKTVDDIQEGADAVLVGESLEEFAKSISSFPKASSLPQ